MTALAHETLEAVMPKVTTPPSDLDDVLWRAWKAIELPEDAEAHGSEDGIGIKAAAVQVIVEVVPPGSDGITRDRTRKRREYARAGIPVYVLIDDHDELGTVTVLTAPDPDQAIYEDEVRAAYGTTVAIPVGPAKGFTIGEDVTGPVRGGG